MTTRWTALAIAAAILSTGSGCVSTGDSVAQPATTVSSTPQESTAEFVIPRPPVDWNAPVIRGIDVTEATAQEVAQAEFVVNVPELPGTLLRIQATDPAAYPPDFRGYGVLFDVPIDGSSSVVRVFIEELPVAPNETLLARNMAANNGEGFELEMVDGVEVVFIQPAERVSAIFVHDGVKYNVYGPAPPRSVIRLVVAALIANT